MNASTGVSVRTGSTRRSARKSGPQHVQDLEVIVFYFHHFVT